MDTTFLKYSAGYEIPVKMQSVIYSHFNDLRRKKGTAEGRDISVRAVARETGLSLPTVQRIATPDNILVGGFQFNTVEVLCKYFDVGVGDLIEYREN